MTAHNAIMSVMRMSFLLKRKLSICRALSYTLSINYNLISHLWIDLLGVDIEISALDPVVQILNMVILGEAVIIFTSTKIS